MTPERARRRPCHFPVTPGATEPAGGGPTERDRTRGPGNPAARVTAGATSGTRVLGPTSKGRGPPGTVGRHRGGGFGALRFEVVCHKVTRERYKSAPSRVACKCGRS